ncbi:MAG: SDR family NAD(P)-dependent oxidoreductase, partial [Candidatus Binataceae bacterium]
MVSGGSSGIGQAFVEELHRRGYQVIFCGRDENKLRAVEARRPGARGFVCDVTDKASVLKFARAVLEQHPSVDLVVSNAGGLHEVDFTAIDVATADLAAELRLNLEGAVHFIAAFLPGLRKAAPSALMVISSGYALAPATRAPLYSAAKAGLRAFTKALRRQLASTGILVTEVAPPAVDTPSVAHRNTPKLPPERVVQDTLAALAKGKTEVYPGAVRFLP